MMFRLLILFSALVISPGGSIEVDVLSEQSEASRRVLRGYAGVEEVIEEPENAAELIVQLGHADWERREAATTQLIDMGEGVRERVEAAADHVDPEVAQRARRIMDTVKKQRENLFNPGIREAAMILARAGDKQTPEWLIRILSHPELKVRQAAAGSLRRISGEDFGYYAREADTHAGAVDRWRTWREKIGDAYAYDSDLESAVLVCNPARKSIIAMDLDGNKLWERRFPESPDGVWIGKDGNLLAGFTTEVLEVDPEGEVVRRLGKKAGLKGVRDVEVLDNGHVLIADDAGGKVVELDRDGNEVWKLENLKHPHAALRTDRGTTLIALHKEHAVIETDTEGKVLRRIEGQGHISDLQTWRDGRHLVVTRMGRKPDAVLLNNDENNEIEIHTSGWSVTSVVLTPEGIVFSANENSGILRGPIEGRIRKTNIARPAKWGKIRVAPRAWIERGAPRAAEK